MTDSPDAVAKSDDAEIEALLDFTPAPRKIKKVNGWTPALQRRFIAKLAETGSPAKAADALGRCRFGAEKVYKADGADSFRAAWDKAIEIAEERAAARQEADRAIWAGVRPPGGIDRRAPGPKPRTRPEAELGPEPEPEPADDKEKQTLFLALLRKYFLKLQSERRARLEGRIAEADFYLRQASFFEVAIDLTTPDAYQALADARRDGVHLIDIAETDMSRLLDDVRRRAWAALGESHPELAWGASEDGSGRPAPPAGHLLADHGTFRTEPLEFTRGGIELSHEEQRAAFRERYRLAAEEQVKWEAGAISSSLSRRDGEGNHAQHGGGDRHAQPCWGHGEHDDAKRSEAEGDKR